MLYGATRYFCCFSFAVFMLGATGQAQDESGGAPIPLVPDVEARDEAALKVAVQQTVALPPAEIVEVVFDLGEIVFDNPGGPAPTDAADRAEPPHPKVDTSGITARAYSRAVEGETGHIGQVMINSLEKGGHSVEVNYRNFTTQLDLNGPELQSGQPVVVRGNRDEIMRAVAALNAKVAAAQVQSDTAETQEEEPQFVGGAAADQSGSAGGGSVTDTVSEALTAAASTDTGLEYPTTEQINDAATVATESGEVVYDVTEEGCSIVIDLALGAAIQQTRVTRTRDGVRESDGECADSHIRYPLTKITEGCQVTVDLASRTATANARLQYTDSSLTTQTVGNCTPDTTKVYDIVEVHSCPVRLDMSSGLAQPQARLVYADHNSRETVVRDCADSESQAAVAYTATAVGCEIVDHLNAGYSDQHKAWVYTLDGVQRIGAGCQSVGDRYPHQRIFKDGSGVRICTPLGNETDFQERYRVAITIDGVRQYRSECMSGGGGSYRITTTTAGCEVRTDLNRLLAIVQEKEQTFRDGLLESEGACADSSLVYVLQKDHAACPVSVDLEAMRAVENFRWFYTNDAGSKLFVNECAGDSGKAYAIAESHSCPVALDEVTGTATPQAKLVYINEAGIETVVRDCADSLSKAAVVFAETAEGCSLIDHFTRRYSEQQTRWRYRLDGVDHAASDCAPSGVEYDHELAFETEAGGKVCPDHVTGPDSWRPRYRIRINIEGKASYRSECLIDETREYRTAQNFETCKERPDFGRGIAVRQARIETWLNGELLGQKDCTDTTEQFVMQRDYVGCPVFTDMAARTVADQFRWGYADDEGMHREVTDCEIDNERVYEIFESDACQIRLDIGQGLATPQGKLVYLDQEETQHVVRDCQDSEERGAVPYVETHTGCGLVDDFANHVSYQYTTWIYELDGELYAGMPCAQSDNPVYELAHLHIFTDDAGNDICRAETLESHYLRYYRVGVEQDVDGITDILYRSGCRPDTAGQLLIHRTTLGCEDMDAWTHDLKGGVSYGQDRAYVTVDGARRYLTDCQDNTSEFRHLHEIVGWQDTPERRGAYALVDVSITTPWGTHGVAQDHLPAGSSLIPYSPAGSRDDVLRREASGCNVRDVYQTVALYTRPDGSSYEENTGRPFSGDWRYSCREELIKAGQYITRFQRQTTDQCVAWGPGERCVRYKKGPWKYYSKPAQLLKKVNTHSNKEVSRFCRIVGAEQEDNRTGTYSRRKQLIVKFHSTTSLFASGGSSGKRASPLDNCPDN